MAGRPLPRFRLAGKQSGVSRKQGNALQRVGAKYPSKGVEGDHAAVNEMVSTALLVTSSAGALLTSRCYVEDSQHEF